MLFFVFVFVTDQLCQNPTRAGLDFSNVVFGPRHAAKSIQVGRQVRDSRSPWQESIQAFTNRGVDFGFRSHKSVCRAKTPRFLQIGCQVKVRPLDYLEPEALAYGRRFATR